MLNNRLCEGILPIRPNFDLSARNVMPQKFRCGAPVSTMDAEDLHDDEQVAFDISALRVRLLKRGGELVDRSRTTSDDVVRDGDP